MIKSFIYLDEQKMYSLSSQIFEGTTEYILNEKSHQNNDSETQNGPFGSGRVLADAVITASKSTEKKFLHDYSFNVFEKHLVKNDMIFDISANGIDIDSAHKITETHSFVKIKARATFNDVEKITELFKEFNNIGRALASVTNTQNFLELREEVDRLKATTKDKTKIRAIEEKYKISTDLTTIAKASGLYHDPEFLENLVLLTKYGFSDQFEISQQYNDLCFTSCLKREFLRETAELLVKKHSRQTQRDIVVFGVVTQSVSTNSPILPQQNDDPNVKAALSNLVEIITNMENSLSGRQPNEIVIDPIAAYFEV
jgi:hypothetical protein